MNRLRLFKTGSIAFIILGLLHLMAHYGMTQSQEQNQVMADMQNFKINMLGEHTLLQFHSGFSIMTGFLISAYGLQNFFGAENILRSKKALISAIFISASGFIIAFIYFHLLAYGFILFSLACYAGAGYKTDKTEAGSAALQKS